MIERIVFHQPRYIYSSQRNLNSMPIKFPSIVGQIQDLVYILAGKEKVFSEHAL